MENQGNTMNNNIFFFLDDLPLKLI